MPQSRRRDDPVGPMQAIGRRRFSKADIGPWLVTAIVLSFAGCGYRVGSVYQPEIRSVHVPIFTSNSFRRGLEFRLTEAVQKEIQNRTHFRLAKAADADSQLIGSILFDQKSVLGGSFFGDARELELSLSVQVSWEDARNGAILHQLQIPIRTDSTTLLATGDFAPEVGQSLATAEQQVIDRLARQIVEMMEMPW